MEIKQIVRLGDTDLNGTKATLYALQKIKGVGSMFANAICRALNIDPNVKLGELSDKDIDRISKFLKEPKLPPWLLNRRFDPENGENKHIIGEMLKFVTKQDIELMKKIKCYKGIRHSLGQPVRGQRTRSHFRALKGKVHLGVQVSARARKAGRV